MFVSRIGMAAPTAGGECVSGTMAEYIALGEQGCTTSYSANVKWSNFGFNGTLNNQQVDSSDVAVSFRLSIS
jgi:hypothetical protein